MMRAEHRRATLALCQFRAIERAVEFRRIGATGHDGDRIPDRGESEDNGEHGKIQPLFIP